MHSIPGLKHCLNLVASISKKLFQNVVPSPNPSPVQITEDKSRQKQQQPNHSEARGKESLTSQQQSSSAQKVQRPKIICFETYLQNRPNPLKGPSFKVGSGATSSQPKTMAQIDEQRTKIQQLRGQDNQHKNYPSKKIENRYSNLVRSSHQSATQKPHLKNRNIYPPIKENNKGSDHSADDELSGDEMKGMGKKDKKMVKKQQKNISVAECLDINTDDMIFTYDDGDDISSIEAKSETTDEIEPQLLSFISKRAMMNNFHKIQEQKLTYYPYANMKKKLSHYQGQTVPKKTSNLSSPKKEKKSEPEPVSRQKTKKRAFQLYPGQTFEQFKKRILIQDKSSSSENSDDDKYFPGKMIKKEEYDRILSQLNSSVSKMDEQKNKQASILVVQKMVDESENQDSENCFKRDQPVLDNIENYKVWDNAGDNASFRLYYRGD